MSDIFNANYLFERRVEDIKRSTEEIVSCTHLFDRTRRYDTGLERLDLRLSAKELRAAADLIERIADRLQGPAPFADEVDLRLVAAE